MPLTGWRGLRRLRQAMTAGAGISLVLAGSVQAEARGPGLERAYRARPRPELLYQMGREAAAQGRQVEAADLWRRYLEEVGEDAPPRRQREVKALLQAAGEAAEVEVQGDSRAILLLDGRVVGVLPLALPLLLSPGAHRLRLESANGKRHAETLVELRAGRRAEVRFTLDNEVALFTRVPAVAVRVMGMEGQPLREQVLAAVQGAVRRERAMPLTAGASLPCDAGRASCLAGAVREMDAQAGLLLRIEGEKGGQVRLLASLWDAVTGEEMAAESGLVLDAGRAAGLAGGLVERVLARGRVRGRGKLSVRSEPAGATVVLDGARRGETPWEREALSGRRQVFLEKAGYRPYQVQVDVPAGEGVAVTAKLGLLPPPGRPLRIAGLSLLGLGLLTVAGGGVLWGLDGYQDCPRAAARRCPDELDTHLGGLWTVVGGGVMLGTAAVLLATDYRRGRR